MASSQFIRGNCLFLRIVIGPAQERALWSVLNTEHGACAFKQVRKLYGFDRANLGDPFEWFPVSLPDTDIDADYFVS
jgi:hypothetical protein